MRHLSQQLFELARLEHGGIKPHLERFAIGELIQDVAQKFDLTIETRQLQLRLDIPHTLPLINADVSMIERVVTNLVDNAVRHTPQGGTIRLKVWQEHDLLQVEVADSGPGVEENMRAQLFQRPSALSQKASRETRGTGATNCTPNAGIAWWRHPPDGCHTRCLFSLFCAFIISGANRVCS